MNFVNLKDYLDITYELSTDGNVIFSGRIETEKMLDIPARSEGEIPLTVQIPERGRTYLKLFYHIKNSDTFRSQGFLMGQEEIELENADSRNRVSLAWQKEAESKKREFPKLRVSDNQRQLIIEGSTFTYVYSKLCGTFDQLIFDGVEFLDRPMELNIWRAPTDNDVYIKNEWYKAMYDKAVSRAYTNNYTLTEESLEIQSIISMSAASVQKMMTMETIWTITNTGLKSVKIDEQRNI